MCHALRNCDVRVALKLQLRVAADMGPEQVEDRASVKKETEQFGMR